jgi:hypothetical protein
MDRKFWKKALREADRKLDSATTRATVNAAAKKLMRAKAELSGYRPKLGPSVARSNPPPVGIDDQTRSLKRLL